MSSRSNKFYTLSATELAGRVKARDINVLDVATSHIERIKEIEPNIKAWKYFNEESVIGQAKKIAGKINRNEKPGSLAGVPVGIKDIFNTLDMPTCMGSPIWEGFTPGNDARAVTYIRWEDGIAAGKTVTAEFAVHHPGQTVNPHNPEHTPGTSSSGSAAAVASFMVPLALGTQTAGSTIRPASYCGVYGFKPSFGLIPRTGILKTLDALDHVAFFSRHPEDLRLLFDVLRAKGTNYPYIERYVDNNAAETYRKSEKFKVAFVRTPAWDEAEKYAQDAITNYISKLSDVKNITVEEAELPEGFEEAHDVHKIIYHKALSYYFKDEYELHGPKISGRFREMVEAGRAITFEKYKGGLEKQNELIHKLDIFFRNYDFIITLSTAGEAPKGLYARDKKDSCLIWTLSHAPSANLPIFKGPNNLPFGAQLITKRYRDYNLLNFLNFMQENALLEVVNTGENAHVSALSDL